MEWYHVWWSWLTAKCVTRVCQHQLSFLWFFCPSLSLNSEWLGGQVVRMLGLSHWPHITDNSGSIHLRAQGLGEGDEHPPTLSCTACSLTDDYWIGILYEQITVNLNLLKTCISTRTFSMNCVCCV